MNLALFYPGADTYAFQKVLKREGSWAKTLSYMAIGWLVVHVAFVTVRGAVLYVSVGRFLPAPGVRSWLLL
jgi:hypothetical protein